MKTLWKRLFKKRDERLITHLTHAFDPDELMLLFPELAEKQLEILDAGDTGLRQIQSGEKSIGRIEREFTRRLIIYGQFYQRRLAEERVRAQFGTSEQERREAGENMHRFDQAGDALKELMFLAIKQEVGVWDKSVAIREDWEVVQLPSRPQIPEFLRGMLGNPPEGS